MSVLEDYHRAHVERRNRFFPPPRRHITLPRPLVVRDLQAWKHGWLRESYGAWTLASVRAQRSARLDTRQIIEAVAADYGVTPEDIVGDRRFVKILRPRQVAMYLAHNLVKLSLPQIGLKFGGRDHTTCLHAVRKIGRLCETDTMFHKHVDDLARGILTTHYTQEGKERITFLHGIAVAAPLRSQFGMEKAE